MSLQAGIWNFDGCPVDSELLERLRSGIVDVACDKETTHLDGAVALLYKARFITQESQLEVQPHLGTRGLVLTWDGRLDNREDLISQLPGLQTKATDTDIVATALEQWGTDCFYKFIGDWALTAWDPHERTLILAKDYLGVRALYYHMTKDRVIWCTELSPLVLLQEGCLRLNDEYIAGYLAMYPPSRLTPYRGIDSVPRASYITIRNGKASCRRYWAFESCKPLRYKADSEYEQHFRSLFRLSVRRRLRSSYPILAELSGGIDSSSIVCMADDIIAQEPGVREFDTISIYDPTEPDGDERSYFSIIETKRGRTGHHIDNSKHRYSLEADNGQFNALPGWARGKDPLRSDLAETITSNGYRVVLSGIGGDELLGGVPDPRAQLTDLMFPPHPLKFARTLVAWSLIKKLPCAHLLCQSALFLLPHRIRAIFEKQATVAAWVNPSFARRWQIAASQLGPTHYYGFWKPSRREYAQTLAALSRQIACAVPHGLCFEEIRYPYVDRTLVEFLLAIPTDQLLRPGQRRSLMRRALVDIVPNEILFRRTKAFIVRSILVNFGINWHWLEKLFHNSLTAQYGYLDQQLLLKYLEKAKNGDSQLLIPVLKAIYLEFWLQGLAGRGLLNQRELTIDVAL